MVTNQTIMSLLAYLKFYSNPHDVIGQIGKKTSNMLITAMRSSAAMERDSQSEQSWADFKKEQAD